MAHTPELEKLERRYDDDPAKWFAQLAEAYRKYERVDDALAILNNHLADRPNYVSALIVLGRCHLDKTDDPEARSAFERVLAIDPENIIALKVLGEVAERSGDPDEAREWLTRLLDVDPANDEAREALDRLGGAPIAADVETAAAAPQVSFGDLAAEVAAAAEGAEAVSGFEPTAVDESVPESAPAGEAAPAPEDEPARVDEPAPALDSASLEATAPLTMVPDPPAAASEDLEIERTPDAMEAPTVELEPLRLEEAPAAAGPTASDEAPELEVETAPEVEAVAPDEPESDEPVAASTDLEIEPFDDSLQWGTGERMSREITAEDVAAAEAAHDESLDHAVVGELPGLEGVEVPSPEESHDVAAVEGLVDLQPPADLDPAEGFEATAADTTPEAAAGVEPAAGLDSAPEMAPDAAPPVPESAPTVETAPVSEPASEVRDRGSLAGLPVILPEEEADAIAAGPPAGAQLPPESGSDLDEGDESEPEPVLTETMAELYVQQGLLGEARAVYEQLLAAKPGDARLAGRLAALRAPARPAAARASNRFAAAETGGTTARTFLQSILDGHAVALPTPPSEPAGSSTIDEAFGAEPLEPKGNPTRPASSSYTLGQVFGEESPPKPPAAQEARHGGSGFSFDEFFGGAGKPPSPAPGAAAPPDEADDDSFRDWLKGLKK